MELFLPQQLLLLCGATGLCPIGLGLCVNTMTKQTSAEEQELEVIQLSNEHHDAVNRRRRIVVQYDAFSQLGADFKQWLDYRFSYVDEPGNQIDSIWWDIGAGRFKYPCIPSIPDISDEQRFSRFTVSHPEKSVIPIGYRLKNLIFHRLYLDSRSQASM